MADEPLAAKTDERASEGMDHLQAAAREMIDAARAFLDVAEEYIEDRERLGRAAGLVSRVAEVAGKTAQQASGLVGDTDRVDHDTESSPRVQHIPVD